MVVYLISTGTVFSIFDLKHLRNITEPEIIKKILSIDTQSIPNKNNSTRTPKGSSNTSKLEPSVNNGINTLDTLLQYLDAVLPI